MAPLTTHVLDTALGCPAARMLVQLAVEDHGSFREVAERITNADGRVSDFFQPGELTLSVYRLRFETTGYFALARRPCFYPWVDVTFRVVDLEHHHHVPLLISPFGYSTYRGS